GVVVEVVAAEDHLCGPADADRVVRVAALVEALTVAFEYVAVYRRGRPAADREGDGDVAVEVVRDQRRVRVVLDDDAVVVGADQAAANLTLRGGPPSDAAETVAPGGTSEPVAPAVPGREPPGPGPHRLFENASQRP